MKSLIGRHESKRARIIARAVDLIIDLREDKKPHRANMVWLSNQFKLDDTLSLEIVMFHIVKTVLVLRCVNDDEALVLAVKTYERHARELITEIENYLK